MHRSEPAGVVQVPPLLARRFAEFPMSASEGGAYVGETGFDAVGDGPAVDGVGEEEVAFEVGGLRGRGLAALREGQGDGRGEDGREGGGCSGELHGGCGMGSLIKEVDDFWRGDLGSGVMLCLVMVNSSCGTLGVFIAICSLGSAVPPRRKAFTFPWSVSF